MTDSQLITLAVEFSVEYQQLGDVEWCCGRYSGPDQEAALRECRARWRAGATGVRVIERRKTQIMRHMR